jgi:hypothetical protein
MPLQPPGEVKIPAISAARAVGLELAVLQVDPRARAVGHEEDLDFRLDCWVELPLRADLPGEHQPLRRLPQENAAPIAFTAVDAALQPTAPDPRLEDRLLRVRLADVFIGERPPSHTGEDLPGAIHGRGLERELGRGGMATVYLAQDLRHKRHVAHEYRFARLPLGRSDSERLRVVAAGQQ